MQQFVRQTTINEDLDNANQEEVKTPKKGVPSKSEKSKKDSHKKPKTSELSPNYKPTPNAHEEIDSKIGTAYINIEMEFYFRELMTMPLITSTDYSPYKLKLPDFPKVQTNKTLLLDLDETLVHVIQEFIDYSSVKINTKGLKSVFFKHPITGAINILKGAVRPFASKLIEELGNIYEIIV